MKYVVTIEERIIHEVTVEAESNEAALQRAEELFGSDEHDEIVYDDLMVASVQKL